MTRKQIHIEKYDFDAFEKEQKPYVMVRTDVIQRMPTERLREGFMWVFLESLPETWKLNKAHLTKHFDISERTYERWMSWLNAVGLIEYRQSRLENGSFGKGRLIVLNGEHFNPGAESSRTVKIGGAVVCRSKKIQPVLGHRTANLPLNGETERSVCGGHINTTEILKKDLKRKTNNNTLTPVFSDTESVKTYLLKVIGNREAYVEDEIVNQGIYYSFETNKNKCFESVNKRINIFLKKVREGKWLIPQGFNGITSQSIREKEEEYEINKKVQHEQDAQAFRQVEEVINTGKPYISLANKLVAYRESLNANKTTMPEKDFQRCN